MHLLGPPVRTRVPVVALLVATALLLGGCASEESEPPLSETLPACDDIWVAGQRLPEDYNGCRDAEGVLQASNAKGCTAGEGTFVTFGARFFAVRGGVISGEGQTSPEYDAAFLECFGSPW